MGQLLKGTTVNLNPVENSSSVRTFIRKLFAVPDVKKYYVLREDHSYDLDAFVEYLADAVGRQRAFNYIIELQDGTKVGLITAELIRDNEGRVMWNIGYAMLPEYRRNGYAKDALKNLTALFQNFNVQYMMLDICTSNTDSEAVAKSCGFQKMRSQTGGYVGFMDPQHMELGMRLRWLKEVRSFNRRDQLNQEAIMCYRTKNYQRSIALYEASLEEPYETGSPFTDGQIYANLGMAYSSVHRYQDAYDVLMRAYNMGVRNASVIKELNWLRNNAIL